MSKTKPAPQKYFERIDVTSEAVTCDGGKGALGHPRVFLHIDRAVGSITCPYCSRHYVLKGNGSAKH